MLIEVVEQVGKDVHPGAIKPPTAETILDGLPRPVAWRDIAPGCPGVQTPQDTSEQLALGFPRVPRLVVMHEVWKQMLNPLPLAILELLTMWHG